MSECEDVRGDGSQPRGTASLDDGNDTKEPEQEPAPQKSEPTNRAKNAVGTEQADGLHRFLRRFKGAFAAEKDGSATTPENVGQDKTLGEKRRGKRDRLYSRNLTWEHGGNLAMMTVPGMLGLLGWTMWLLAKDLPESSLEVMFVELMEIRRISRQCLAATPDVGLEGFNQCPFGLDLSVSAGMTLVSGLFGVECVIIAVFSFQSRASVGRHNRRETIMSHVWSDPGRALVFWLIMYCCVWLPILYVCLVWTPGLEVLPERPLGVVLLSMWPIWVVAAASVVIPIWLYGYAVKYTLKDVERRRHTVWWEYERAYRLIRVKVASDVEARDVVQARGKAAHVGRWIAFGLMLLIGPLLAGTFLPYAPARFLGLFSVLALLDAFCVYFVAYAWSWGRAQGVFLVIVSGFAGCFCAVVTVMCFMVYGVVASSPASIPAGLAVLVLLVLAWSVVIMRGVDAAMHPVTVIRARLAMRRSDELVWLRAQERRLVSMGMGESAVKARLRGLRRAASRKRPSKRLRAGGAERSRRTDKRC
ncbi:hypothetical protein [Actinomyces glycerinitolerans]|uniref:Transmembrane protein n=1 Tax=Actinomyces glycerinitolerans TaxID=1892869 RepID=A0A1M4RWS5_9ACTO|nr:hypothetical protein [Actinomyces glycerinitolerans]SHE24435.1 Hypothetical protein ACGLYG10_0636 [Actinomyces glycerinitolerans]